MTRVNVAGGKRRWAIVHKIWLPVGIAIGAHIVLAGIVFADNCSTEGDCLQTAGYLIASALASSGMGVVSGLLGSNMATTLQGAVQQRVNEAATESVPATGITEEPVTVTESVDHVVREHTVEDRTFRETSGESGHSEERRTTDTSW